MILSLQHLTQGLEVLILLFQKHGIKSNKNRLDMLSYKL